MKYQYANQEVKEVSEYLQKYMTKNFVSSLTADQCAELLNNANILSILLDLSQVSILGKSLDKAETVK